MDIHAEPEPAKHDTVVTEYGLVFDCDAQGCDERHEDDVMPRGTVMPVTVRVNGHAVRVVQRTVTYSPWIRVSPPIPKGVWRHQDDGTSCPSFPDSFDWTWTDEPFTCHLHGRVMKCILLTQRRSVD